MKNILIEKIVKEFDVPVKRMRQIKKAVGGEMDAGLAGRKSSLAMLQAYCDAASGREKGFYPALDLGGTNFRVMMVRLQGGKKPKVLAEAKYRLTEEQISGTGDVLFNAIAGYLGKFMKENRFNSEYGLGYTFSFPVKLIGIDEGILMKWTKDFSATGVVGKKIVELQRQAMASQGLDNVKIVALANDTVGTLQTQAVEDPNCIMGVILGTGFNICVRVSSKRIKKGVGDYSGKCMIINMEAGGFAKALPFTDYDRQLDRESGNKGHQFAEKMISGKYLPQLVRLLVVDLVKKEGLFGGRVPSIFKNKDTFQAWYMDVFETGSEKEITKLGKKVFDKVLTTEERIVLALVCHAVARRSARIAASIIAGALTRVERRSAKKATVAIDGSLFEKYPGYSRMLNEAIRELEGSAGKSISTKLTKDGSGIGAAVIAAVVSANR
jgi:hexokinase